MLNSRSSSARRAHLRILTTLLLTGAVVVGNAANAQVLVRVSASSAAHQGPNVVGSQAEVHNGVVTTFAGNGGTATASPSGAGITHGRAETYQPGGAGTAVFSSGTTTTADLRTARHTGAVLTTPYDNFGSPSGSSNSRLEDVVTFANGTGAPVSVSVSWLVDGFVTPPGAPFVGSHDVRGTLRLWGVSASTPTPTLRGVSGPANQLRFAFVNGTRSYQDDLNGTIFQPGNGSTWTITPIGSGGARMDSVLTLPVGLSAIRVMNSLDIDCRAGMSCDYSLTGAQMMLGGLPAGVTMASSSGAFLGAAAPSPSPAGLGVQSIAGNQVTLRWTPPTSTLATGYVLQGGIAPGQTLASLPTGSTATTFTFNAPTGIFYLRILAQTSNGTSAPTNEVTAYVNVPAPPSAPAALLGLASGARLGLSWRNTSGGGTPTGMVLDVSGAIAGTLPLPVGETFAFNSVPPGTYTFAVRSTNPSGTSAPSAPVTLTFPSACPGTPQAPANLQVTRTGNQLAISWDPPAAGAALSHYVLTVSGPLSLAIPLGLRTIGGPVGPGTYTFTVAAVNACGTGAASTPQAVTVP